MAIKLQLQTKDHQNFASCDSVCFDSLNSEFARYFIEESGGNRFLG